MKRVIAASIAAAGLVAGVIAVGGPAGAALKPHHTATAAPTITVSKTANLKAEGVKVSGSGFPANTKLTAAECNSDGAIPLITEGCQLFNSGPTTNSSGSFSNFVVHVVDGSLKTVAPDSNANAPAQCPQDQLQASKGVACVLAISDLSVTGDSAFVPILFKAPVFTTKVAKGDIKKGKQTYRLSISEVGTYAKSDVGGFEVIGTSKNSDGKTVDGQCQASSSGDATWPSVGLPPCTGRIGEPIKLLLNNKLVKTWTASTSASNPGGVTKTVDGILKGKYNIELLGAVSGESVEVLHVNIG